MRVGWVMTNDPSAIVTRTRRGIRAKGRARNRGRSVVGWLVFAILTVWQF